MRTVTLDTSILPADDLIAEANQHEFEFAAITVTYRETENTSFELALTTLLLIPETAVWDESRWDQAIWGPAVSRYHWEQSKETPVRMPDVNELETVLGIISNGAFPKDRASLSTKQRHQLRDAIIFLSHVRENRDIFLTNDTTAFIKHGRREKLERLFNTRIMTQGEFVAYCKGLSI